MPTNFSDIKTVMLTPLLKDKTMLFAQQPHADMQK